MTKEEGRKSEQVKAGRKRKKKERENFQFRFRVPFHVSDGFGQTCLILGVFDDTYERVNVTTRRVYTFVSVGHC